MSGGRAGDRGPPRDGEKQGLFPGGTGPVVIENRDKSGSENLIVIMIFFCDVIEQKLRF